MGTASKFLSIVLRLLEFSFAAVILGIIATFLHYIRNDGMAPESRLIYGITLAAISIVASIALFWPAKYSFYAFPLDFILFVMWIVCFALLEAVRLPRPLKAAAADHLSSRATRHADQLGLEIIGQLTGEETGSWMTPPRP